MLCCTVLNTIARLQQGTDIKLWLLLTQIKVNIDLSASASSSTAVREHHFSIITETSSSYPHDTHSCTTPSCLPAHCYRRHPQRLRCQSIYSPAQSRESAFIDPLP